MLIKKITFYSMRNSNTGYSGKIKMRDLEKKKKEKMLAMLFKYYKFTSIIN